MEMQNVMTQSSHTPTVLSIDAHADNNKALPWIYFPQQPGLYRVMDVFINILALHGYFHGGWMVNGVEVNVSHTLCRGKIVLKKFLVYTVYRFCILRCEVWFLQPSFACTTGGLLCAARQCTVRCRYNAVDFLQNLHKRHPTARLLGRDTGFFCGFKFLFIFYFTATAMMFSISYYIALRYNDTDCILGNNYINKYYHSICAITATCSRIVWLNLWSVSRHIEAK